MDAAITSIRVNGFRAFTARELNHSFLSPNEKPSNTLVIAGVNGSGKTTLLEAILFVLGREELIQSALGPSSHPHPRSRFPEQAKIEATFRIESADGSLWSALAPCDVKVTRTTTEHCLVLCEGGNEKLLADPYLESLCSEISVHYFSSWRRPELRGAVFSAGRSLKKVPSERNRLQHLKQRLLNERLLKLFPQTLPHDDEWLEKLSRVWQRLHGDLTRLDFWARSNSSAEGGFDLAVIRDSEEGPIPLFFIDEASSGELEMVTMFGVLIIENFHGILLYDEPELHLHPRWQVIILPLLQEIFPRAQLFFATHSDDPWDQVYTFQRILLERSSESELEHS